jgi:hypothetical protein
MTTATITQPVMCQNMTPGPLVIASSPKSDNEVIFGGHGNPNGEDVQPIPEGLLAAPAFSRALKQGTLKVVLGDDNPIVQGALQAQSDAYWKRMDTDKLAAMETLEAPKDDDLVAVQCIGPGTREGVQCEDTVPVRAREKDSKPPLCDRHAVLLERCVRRGSGAWAVEQ